MYSIIDIFDTPSPHPEIPRLYIIYIYIYIIDYIYIYIYIKYIEENNSSYNSKNIIKINVTNYNNYYGIIYF